MRYFLMLLFFVLFLMGCFKSDCEQFNGKWKFDELKFFNGEVMYFIDFVVQKKIVDKIVKE